MKLRLLIPTLIFALIMGLSGSSFASDSGTDAVNQLLQLQNKYDPLYDIQHERLMAIYKKIQSDKKAMASFKFITDDFDNVRRILSNSYKNPDSDLTQVKDYAEEELGEFEYTLALLEKQYAKKLTITCIKGKLSKKVTAYSPVCPTGYKKK